MQIVQLLDRTPFWYENITITTLAVSRLNATYRAAAKAVFITIEDNSIRYRAEGGDPTAVEGHLVPATMSLYFANPKAIKELRMIAIGGNAVAVVTYYK